MQFSTVKLHNELRQYDFIKRYVHISTPEVYGSCSGFVDESFSYNPSTPYAVSRAAGDMSLQTFYSAYKFPVVTTHVQLTFMDLDNSSIELFLGQFYSFC